MSDIITDSVKTDRFTMDYCRFGRGERYLVILPGVSMKPVTPQGAAVAAQYAAFTDRYTVFLFDRIREISDGYSVRDMARDTAEAMRLLGIRDADLFGASQGGMMAIVISAEHPELVRRMALGSTLARQNVVSRSTFDRWCDLAAGSDVCALNRAINDAVYSPDYRERFRDAFAAMEQVGTPEEMHRFGILAEACRGFDGYADLSRITCPVSVIGSREDHVMTGEASEEIAAALGCDCYLYDGYSHAVYDEAPDYSDRLLRFFTQD